MTTHEDLRRICQRLPGSEAGEGTFSYGVNVNGKVKGYVWTWLERQSPKGKRLPNERVVAIRTPGLESKKMILEAHPEFAFTEPHYDGYPAVLVRLDDATSGDLEDLLVEAWRSVAPKKEVKLYDEQSESI